MSSPWLPRLLLGVAAVVVLAGVISLSVGEWGPKKIAIDGAEQTQQLIAGIPQDGAYLGPSDAPVTITVFNDLQCAGCDDYELDTVNADGRWAGGSGPGWVAATRGSVPGVTAFALRIWNVASDIMNMPPRRSRSRKRPAPWIKPST